MANKNGRVSSIQTLVRSRLGEAENKLKELQTWAGQLGAEDLRKWERQAKDELSRRAVEARRQILELQHRALGWVGAASQSQLKQLKSEVTRLAKKVDQAVGRRGSDA
jgi:hypothetical protein